MGALDVASNAAAVRGDHGKAGGERFEDHESEYLAVRRKDQQTRVVQHSSLFATEDGPHEFHALGQLQFPHHRLKSRKCAVVLSDYQEPSVLHSFVQYCKCSHQAVDSFYWVHPS